MNEKVFTNYCLLSKSEFHTSFYITFKIALSFFGRKTQFTPVLRFIVVDLPTLELV